jgi:hypothetical protein
MKLFEIRNLIDVLDQYYAYDPNMTITEGKKVLQRIQKVKAEGREVLQKIQKAEAAKEKGDE